MPVDEIVDSTILLNNNENSIENPFRDASINIQEPINRIEDLINVDAFDFPVLGSLGVTASKWIVQLKLKLREMGANGYSLYDWPEDLMNMFLAYPLSDIMEFDIQAAKHAENNKNHAKPKEWKRVDTDGIFSDTDVTSVFIDTRGPYNFLNDKFKAVFEAYPPFHNFFSQGMSGTRIQKQLFDIYVGMWTAREFVSMVVRASIPSDYWNEFTDVKILSVFFDRFSTLLTKIEWKDLGNLFENFNKYLHYDQTELSVDSILETAVDMKDIAQQVRVLDSLTPQHIQHYLYLHLISLFKAKISKSCDVSDDIFNLESLETLRPPKLLTQESANKVLINMLKHAQKYLPRDAESSGHLARLPKPQVVELRRKILEGSLSDEDRILVKQYKFLFKYVIEKRKNLEMQEREGQKGKISLKQKKAGENQSLNITQQKHSSPRPSHTSHSNTTPAIPVPVTQSTMITEPTSQPAMVTIPTTQPAVSNTTQSVESSIPSQLYMTTQHSQSSATPHQLTSEAVTQPFAPSITAILSKELVHTAVPISRSSSVSSTNFQSPYSHQSSLEPRETQNLEELARQKRKFNELENVTKTAISPTPPPPLEPSPTARVVRPTKRVLNPDF